jgi:site-specific recombinase XerC
MPSAPFCFECWPGGPVAPPPCLKCGSRKDYFSSGLCARCHPWTDPGPDSCLDCLAWGARRHNKWLCRACLHWRRAYANPANGGGIGPCPACGRTLTLGARGVCRLCLKHAKYVRQPGDPWDPIAANKHGQQLFFADMFRYTSTQGRPRDPANEPAPHPADDPAPNPLQPPLFTAKPDLAAHGRTGLHRRAHPDDAAPLEAIARKFATTEHWTGRQRRDAIIGVRIMLGVQDNRGEPILASHVEALRDIDLPVWSVLKILSTAGVLIDDRTPRIDAWFHERVDPLPKPMGHELGIWFDIKKNGSTTAPRMLPRSEITIQTQLTWALPTLRAWADTGHSSLRDITREDILNALPAGGVERARTGQGLKSVFRLLKARKVLFTDPTARIQTGEHPSNLPVKLDVNLIVTRLNSDNPATAAVVALVAFHGLRLQQLQRLQLTDFRDGKLHIDGRTIPVAEPVRQRLAIYLTHRNTTWPETLNPHLFVNQRTWRRYADPAGVRWFRLTIGVGLTSRQLREDRILNEVDATGGDMRAIADLFGLSINAATRYVPRLEAADLVPGVTQA